MFIAGSLLLPQLIYAQQMAPEVLHRFPPSVTVQVFLVASKTTLGTSSQLWLASRFQYDDSISAELMLKGASNEMIRRRSDSAKKAQLEDFKKILAPAERAAWEESQETARKSIKGRSMEGMDMTSMFTMALEQYKELALTDNQIDSLAVLSRECKQKGQLSQSYPDSVGVFDRPAFESRWLGSLLTARQYDRLLAGKHKNAAWLQARYQWFAMKQKEITDSLNKDKTIQQLAGYYLQHLILQSRWAYNKPLMDSAVKALETNGKPAPLLALEKANRKAPLIKGRSTEGADMISQFGKALALYRELRLNDTQVDSLMAKAREIRIKTSLSQAYGDSLGQFDRVAFESEYLGRFLTDQQFRYFLYEKNKDHALQQARYQWHLLQQKGLADSLNKERTIQQLNDYYLKRFIALDRVAHDPAKKWQMQSYYDKSKPGPLVALDKANRLGANHTAGSGYIW